MYFGPSLLGTVAYCNAVQLRQQCIQPRGAEAGQSSPSMLSLIAAPRETRAKIPSALDMNALGGDSGRGTGRSMDCSECRELYRTLERRNTRYLEARSATFFQISGRIAARKHIELQRALSDLQEHQADCPWAIAATDIGRLVTLKTRRNPVH